MGSLVWYGHILKKFVFLCLHLLYHLLLGNSHRDSVDLIQYIFYGLNEPNACKSPYFALLNHDSADKTVKSTNRRWP